MKGRAGTVRGLWFIIHNEVMTYHGPLTVYRLTVLNDGALRYIEPDIDEFDFRWDIVVRPD